MIEDPVAIEGAGEEQNGLARTISRLRERWRDIAESAHHVIARQPQEELSRRDALRVRDEIVACIEGRGGDVASRARAAALGQTYLGLADAGRKQFLGILAAENTIDPASVATQAQAVLDAGESVQTDMRDLRAALEPPARQVFRQFNSLPEGI